MKSLNELLTRLKWIEMIGLGLHPENDIELLRFEHTKRQEYYAAMGGGMPMFEFISAGDVLQFYLQLKEMGAEEQWDETYSRFKKTFGTPGRDMEEWKFWDEGHKVIKLKSKQFVETIKKYNLSL